MRILALSHVFAPSIGGIEGVTEALASAWARLGHEVTVVTATPADRAEDDARFPFRVVRGPLRGQLLSLARSHDIFWQNNISLRSLWAGWGSRRPVFVSHQTWLRRVDGEQAWQDRAKQLACRQVHNIAISEAVAAELQAPSVVIPNPYRANLFDAPKIDSVPRDRDVVFVGRLVSDKGADLLVEALQKLRQRGHPTKATFIGDGPEAAALRKAASAANLAIDFTGPLPPPQVAQQLRCHRIMAVPSRWPEPFGIVALEGLASGCQLVVSAAGGLPEAAGPDARIFPNGDAQALATQLEATLATTPQSPSQAIRQHLAQHRLEAVAKRYIEAFTQPYQ